MFICSSSQGERRAEPTTTYTEGIVYKTGTVLCTGKTNCAKSHENMKIHTTETYGESKILGVYLPSGISKDRILGSFIRILNILGKQKIAYGDLEKFGIGMLITYGEIIVCYKLKRYIQIRWFGSDVEHMAEGITWLRRNPYAACQATRLAYLTEAANTCGVSVAALTGRDINPNSCIAMQELRDYISKYREVNRKIEQLKDRQQPIIVVNLIKADDWADPYRDTSWDVEATDLEKALNNKGGQKFQVIDKTSDSCIG